MVVTFWVAGLLDIQPLKVKKTREVGGLRSWRHPYEKVGA